MKIVQGKCFIILLCFCALECYALTCRSEGNQKDDDLKKIYESCLKRQENNNSENQRYSSEHDWKNKDRGRSRNKDDKSRNRDNQSDNRSNGMSEHKYNGMNNREQNMDEGGDRDRMEGRESRNNMYDRGDNGYNSMRDNERTSNSDGTDNRNGRDRNMMTRNEHLSGRDEFLQSEEYGSEMPRQNYYSSQSNRRNKREKRVEKNSGQRSQYNPNSRGSNGHDNANDSRNSSTNSSKDQDKACALHCLLENMQMTGENGMPDRYLVTHAITKNMKNEDLRDFLQESIEECFQILDNENTEDKCEFSKNLLLCLSEKGRANCDDWKDNYKF